LGTQVHKIRVELGVDHCGVLDTRTILYSRLAIDLQACLQRGHLGTRVLVQEAVILLQSDASSLATRSLLGNV
jgi:hypothetical protein